MAKNPARPPRVIFTMVVAAKVLLKRQKLLLTSFESNANCELELIMHSAEFPFLKKNIVVQLKAIISINFKVS